MGRVLGAQRPATQAGSLHHNGRVCRGVIFVFGYGALLRIGSTTRERSLEKMSCRTRVYMLFISVQALLLLACQTMPGDPTNNSPNPTGSSNPGSTTGSPTLFVLDGRFGITSYGGPVPNGNVPPLTNLSLLNDDLAIPRRYGITRTGQLIVSRIDDSLIIFDNAKTVTGSVQPNRIVKGNATLFNNPKSLALDVANDRLFVAGNNATDGILVFDNVSSTAFNGNVAPSRTFIPDAFGAMNVNAMSLDSTGALFVYDENRGNIVV